MNDDRKNSSDDATFQKGLAGLLELPGVAGGRWAVPAKVELRPVVDQSWDYAISMTFASLADHDSYQVDPDHLRFVETFKPWWAKVLVMDLA